MSWGSGPLVKMVQLRHIPLHACLLSCVQLCDPVGYSLPGPSVHGVLQAILGLVAISFSRGLPDPGIEPTSPASPAVAGRFFTTEPPGKATVSVCTNSKNGAKPVLRRPTPRSTCRGCPAEVGACLVKWAREEGGREGACPSAPFLGLHGPHGVQASFKSRLSWKLRSPQPSLSSPSG